MPALRLVIALFLVLHALAGAAQPMRLPSLTKDYRLVFADEFRYPSRDSLLSPHQARWSAEHTWGTGYWDPMADCKYIDQNNYAYRPDDIRLLPNPENSRDQLLALDFTYHPVPLAQVVSKKGIVVKGQIYKTSGLVRALFQGDTACPDTGFKYGIFEIRCKAPALDGLQAAFWLWNAGGACGVTEPNWDFDHDTWEIDGFETFLIGNRRDFFSTRQANVYSQHKPSATHFIFPWGQAPDTDFHVYTVVWTPNLVAWYADGRLYKMLRNPPGAEQELLNPAGIPRTELNLLISAHYQWDCKKNYHCDLMPDGVTPNDQQCPQPNDPFLIDYIRVYRPRQLDANGKWPLVEKRNRQAEALKADPPNFMR